MPLTREEVFALIDEKIFTNNSAQIQAADVNALLKTIYDNAPVSESPIKVLRAKISQSGTSAPTFHTIFENTIGTFSFSYINTGIYRITGAFPDGKVFINFYKQFGMANSLVIISPTNLGYIEIRCQLETTFNSYSFNNNILNQDMLEILVYP